MIETVIKNPAREFIVKPIFNVERMSLPNIHSTHCEAPYLHFLQLLMHIDLQPVVFLIFL
jgi:hypothetical protein